MIRILYQLRRKDLRVSDPGSDGDQGQENDGTGSDQVIGGYGTQDRPPGVNQIIDTDEEHIKHIAADHVRNSQISGSQPESREGYCNFRKGGSEADKEAADEILTEAGSLRYLVADHSQPDTGTDDKGGGDGKVDKGPSQRNIFIFFFNNGSGRVTFFKEENLPDEDEVKDDDDGIGQPSHQSNIP